MAQFLWGKVYYKDTFAGILREEPGSSTSFEYDESYLDKNQPAISHTLPLKKDKLVYHNGLVPFFDNLVAEGWMENAQMRLLGKKQKSRFELLLAFGYDCAGAVSVIDPNPQKLDEKFFTTDPREIALLTSRASLSGVQPKLALVFVNGKFYPAKIGQLSTHIAKFSSPQHLELVMNEYLTILATKAFLPEDQVVACSIQTIEGFEDCALIIERFDRANGERIHFEEFNQLLNKQSSEKYDASYQDMSLFIRQTKDCFPVENYRLFARILVSLLLGNTDIHMKNFAMFHTEKGLSLTPSYDLVAAALYDYKTIALTLAGINNLKITALKPKHILFLLEEFGLSKKVLKMLLHQIEKNKPSACHVIRHAPHGSAALKEQIIEQMEKRWNGTYALIGQLLSKKQ